MNNVGMLGPHQMPFLGLDRETVVGIVNVNVLTATFLCHALLPKMKKKGKGAVINISSIANYFVGPYISVYTATKHYMSAFTQSIAAEYSDSGITIQCIEPGAVETAMTQYFDEVRAFITKTWFTKYFEILLIMNIHLSNIRFIFIRITEVLCIQR